MQMGLSLFSITVLLFMAVVGLLIAGVCVVLAILRKRQGDGQQPYRYEPIPGSVQKEILETLGKLSSGQMVVDQVSIIMQNKLGDISGIDDVLKMVADKKISSEEGLKLINALAEGKRKVKEQFGGFGAVMDPSASEAKAKKLCRSKTSRTIAGICGGFADYFGQDPTLTRLLFIVLVLITGGMGILFYLICWIVIPDESNIQKSKTSVTEKSEKRYGALALILNLGGIAVAIIIGMLARIVGPIPWPHYLIVIAFQIAAFMLGIVSRKELLGKIASIISAVLLSAAVLLMLRSIRSNIL